MFCLLLREFVGERNRGENSQSTQWESIEEPLDHESWALPLRFNRYPLLKSSVINISKLFDFRRNLMKSDWRDYQLQNPKLSYFIG